jgi:hypothetical protein
MTYYVQGKEIPFANKDELQRQIPMIKKKFLYAGDFAKANFDQFFSKDKFKSSTILKAWNFANSILINDGKGNFEMKSLPWQAQLTTYRAGVITDVNDDGRPDVLFMGNFYDNNVQMGRYDADFGSYLVNTGNATFEVTAVTGSITKGQVRRILTMHLKGKDTAFVLARNSDSLKVIRIKKQGN